MAAHGLQGGGRLTLRDASRPLGFAAALALVAIVGLHTGAGHRFDVRVASELAGASNDGLLYDFSKGAHLGDPRPAFVLSAAVVALALGVGGVRDALRVGVVLLAANLTTVVLAATVSIPRTLFGDDDLWPSNHTTAVAAAGLCLLLIAPPRLRPLAALLAFGMAAGITLMLLIRGTHYVTDLVAGLLVAGFWAVLAAQSGRRLKIGRGSSLMTSITQRRKPGT